MLKEHNNVLSKSSIKKGCYIFVDLNHQTVLRIEKILLSIYAVLADQPWAS